MRSQHSQFVEIRYCESQQPRGIVWQHDVGHRSHTHGHVFEDTRSYSEGTLESSEKEVLSWTRLTSCILC
jgi:hypothetical protein